MEKISVNGIKDRLPKVFKVKADKRDNRNVFIYVDLNKLNFETANNIVNAICKKFNMNILGAGVDLLDNIRDWHIKMFEDDKDRIQELIKDKQNSDLFVSVRQRVAAFKYYSKFYQEKFTSLDETLDSAYRFLNKRPDVNFLDYCAKREKMELTRYVEMLLEFDNYCKEKPKKNKKSLDPLKNEISLKQEISILESVVAGAKPFLVLYDGGKYDTKKTLIDKITKAREILSSRDPNNHHIIEMFKHWNSTHKGE